MNCRASNIQWAFGIALCALSIGGCAQQEAVPPAGSIVVGVRTGPNNIDPRFANDEASARVAQLMFNTLLDIGDDLRPAPIGDHGLSVAPPQRQHRSRAPADDPTGVPRRAFP